MRDVVEDLIDWVFGTFALALVLLLLGVVIVGLVAVWDVLRWLL